MCFLGGLLVRLLHRTHSKNPGYLKMYSLCEDAVKQVQLAAGYELGNFRISGMQLTGQKYLLLCVQGTCLIRSLGPQAPSIKALQLLQAVCAGI